MAKKRHEWQETWRLGGVLFLQWRGSCSLACSLWHWPQILAWSTLCTWYWILIASTKDLKYAPFAQALTGQIWRLVTSFLYQGALGFGFLINLMFMYPFPIKFSQLFRVQYGASVENTTFGGVTADYLTFILFCSTLLLVPGFFVPLHILGTGLILSIIYYW